jgi:hypothetical protein
MTQYAHFNKYKSVLTTLNLSKLTAPTTIPASLEMARDTNLSVHYIPFEYVNPEARIVLVGITPGFTQLKNSFIEAQKQLKMGSNDEATLIAVKKTGAFSGSMRPNLVAMIDHLKISDWLRISGADELFGKSNHLVHTTSILRYPVFVDGENYNGSPNMTRHPMLQQQIRSHFAKEVEQLKNAVFIPLGPKVSEGLMWMAKENLIDSAKVLDGMPHPSGANAERIAYFLGKKKRSDLSVKTDPNKLDALKDELIKKISRLSAQQV